MTLIHKLIRIFLYQTRQAVTNKRIGLIFILVGMYIYSTVSSVDGMVDATGIAPTQWIFPHLTSDYIVQMIIIAGGLVLFCDAPFLYESHWYLIGRSGRLAWSLGQILYIMFLSFLYLVFVNIISVVSLLPQINFTIDSWGKIWGTLARTNAGQEFSVTFSISDFIIGTYTPVQAFLDAFYLEWLCLIWLALLLYIGNCFSGHYMGVLMSSSFVILDILIYNEWIKDAYRFSPVTLAQLTAFSSANAQYGVTKEYAHAFFGISFFVLSLLCVAGNFKEKWFSRKISIIRIHSMKNGG